jgi:RIO kinase 1
MTRQTNVSFDRSDRMDDSDERYTDLADRFNPLAQDRAARRKRKPKAKHTPKKAVTAIIEEIAEAGSTALEGVGFKTTYVPARYEEGWLLESLSTFYEGEYITDVLARVKGGKEANVYCCRAHPSTKFDLLAAKVYRPRMFRQLRNDAMYREGRGFIAAEDADVSNLGKDSRTQRAVASKSSYGAEVLHTSWLMHEYTTLQTLFAAGAAVPEPVAVSSNSVLMGYCGDLGVPARHLVDVRLERDEAHALFGEVLRNVEIMLRLRMIHGDLSAYNILYHDGEITLIDFPQVTDSVYNPNAQVIFQRDIERICEYFTRQGVQTGSPLGIARRLWKTYLEMDADVVADRSRFEAQRIAVMEALHPEAE